ncbi:MAG: NAD-dependent epimerase/dehydratase family protein [Pyrinomonadaceae bacterium]
MAAKRKNVILVTGGTGFLGNHIVRQLLDAGEKNLRVMASRIPQWMSDAGVEPIVGSVTEEKDVAAASKGVSVIFHLAGKVSRDNRDAVQMNRVHVQGTRLLSEAAVEAGVKTMVLASSSGTIAVSEEPEMFDETYPQPVNLISRFSYYASKFYQEKTALRHFKGKGTKLVILNPSLLLGEGDERLSSTKPVLDFLAGKIPFTPSGGLNFVDAADAAKAFISAVEKGVDGERYLVGAENMTFSDFFGRLERLSGVSAPVMRVPKSMSVPAAGILESMFKNVNKVPPVEAKEVEQAELFWYFDSTKAREELGFSPRDPQQTLNDTIKYIKRNFLGEGIF